MTALVLAYALLDIDELNEQQYIAAFFLASNLDSSLLYVISEEEIADELKIDWPSFHMIRYNKFFYGDNPKIYEVSKFPTKNFIEQSIKFNRNYQEYLLANKEFNIRNKKWFDMVMEENETLYKTYACLLEVQQKEKVLAKRVGLGKFKDLIGPDNFYSGSLPPAVPMWRFIYLE